MAIARIAIATPVANTPGLNSSLAITLASTTIGDFNVVTLSCHSTPGFAGIQPVIATPAGWTLIGDSWKTGTPSHEIASFYRFFQSGDPSSVTVSWGSGTNQAGNGVGGAVSYSGVDTTTPIVGGEVAFTTSAGATVNTTSALTLGGSRWVVSVFGNRSGATWSASTDAIQYQKLIATSADVAYCDSGAATSSGTARSATSSASTSVNNVGIFALNPATGGLTGTASLAVAAAVTAVGTGPGTASLTATATVTATSALTGLVSGASQTVTASISAAGTVSTPVTQWIANTPMYVAHRGSELDWPEMTIYAYTHSAAWNPKLALNVDGWRSSDSIWVGSHDQTTARVFGTNIDIPSNTYSALSGLLTIATPQQPICRVIDVLQGFPGRIFFVENKSGTNGSDFLDTMDANGGPSQIIIKFYGPSNVTASAAAQARGYKTWGYYFDADTPSLPTTASAYDLLGEDYTATTASWTAILTYGKPVLGHIIPSAAAATTAFGLGATGLMVSKVTAAVPGVFSGAASLNVAAAVTATGGVAYGGTSTLAATATITASGKVQTGSALTVTAAITATGTANLSGTASLPVSATVTAAGTVTTGNASFVATTATITATGTVAATTAAMLPVTATITGTGTASGTAASNVTATITATGTTTSAYTGAASLATTATVTATGQVAVSGTAVLGVTATITASTGQPSPPIQLTNVRVEPDRFRDVAVEPDRIS